MTRRFRTFLTKLGLPRSLPGWGHLAAIVQAIAVVPTLVFVLLQMNHANNIARAANSTSFVEQGAAFSALLVQNEKLAWSWFNHGQNLRPNSMDERIYAEALTEWLVFHENVFNQNRRGLLNAETYSSWQADLTFTVTHHNLALIGRDIRELFPGPFGECVHDMQIGVRKSCQ